MSRSFDESVPVWRENAAREDSTDAPARPASLVTSTRVCIIGAGISGLTTAYLLQRAGIDAQVIDAHGVAAGETGRTTAHLSAALDDRFFQLEKLFGKEGARLATA